MNAVSGYTDISEDLVAKLWEECCDYISSNAMVTYSWVGVNPTSGAPDPIWTQIGKLNATPHSIVTRDAIQIPDYTIPNAASVIQGLLGGLMTTDELGWVVEWNDPTFQAAAFVTIPGAISLSPTRSDDRFNAFLNLCTQICTGITSASCTPTTPGVHGAFTGTATFISIV